MDLLDRWDDLAPLLRDLDLSALGVVPDAVTVPRLIAQVSRIVTREPGDVILTGTPTGVGMPRRTFLRAGDVVVTEIDGIGRLENRMVKA